MIGTIDIEIQAKNPNMPLWPLRAYVNSPSSLRIRNVPKKIGQWEITSVQVTATYPEKTQKTAQCVLVGGVWVGTIEGSPASGTCTNGYTVIADGIDENGNPVSGYVLGRGDVEILKEDGTPIEDPTHFVTDDELDAAISSKAEISDVDDVANDLADLSNSLSDYYTKNETSSATEIQTALDGYVTSAQVEPALYPPGYADRSIKTMRVVKEVGTTVDESTYLATVQADNDKSTDAVIRAQTYDSFFLSSYNGETFDPPIELKYGYCTRVYRVITIGGKDRQVYVSINSNAWYAQLERTFHLIKAEYTRPYYWPVESMYLSATSYPVTYNENKTSIETVNGQSGIIACSRATQYPTELTWPLAYRNEVSAKADLSALAGYLPLSGGQVNGFLSVGNDVVLEYDLGGGIVKVADGNGNYTYYQGNWISHNNSTFYFPQTPAPIDYTLATQEWVLEQLSALEARIATLENN